MKYLELSKIELKLPTFKDSDGEVYVPLSAVRQCITSATAENVREVVSCKDCKFRYTATCFAKHETADCDYCSCGERSGC